MGLRQRGQSLLELAFIAPLLVIMILGTVEIGWYANHILILLEVTRVGARNATVATGELSPLQWIEDGTIHPVGYLLESGYSFSTTPLSASYPGIVGIPDYAIKPVLDPGDLPPPYDGVTRPVPVPGNALNYRQCENTDQIGFYNYIACAMIQSMDPLVLRGRINTDQAPIAKKVVTQRSTQTEDYLYPDDIVISVFALQLLNNAQPSDWDDNDAELAYYPRTHNFGTTYPPGFRVHVVGRYPRTANECNVIYTPTAPDTSPAYLAPEESALRRILGPLAQFNEYTTTGSISGVIAPALPQGNWSFRNHADGRDFRDPFDLIPNGTRDRIGGRDVELDGLDTNPEFQRGYSWTGQHIVEEYYANGSQLVCIGSEWTDAEIEELMNAPRFLQQGVVQPPNGDLTDTAWNVCCRARWEEWQQQARQLPSQGMVLVEIFWNHTTLLNFPFLQTMLQIFGDTQRIEIAVWAAFPVPAAEPNIVFQLPPD